MVEGASRGQTIVGSADNGVFDVTEGITATQKECVNKSALAEDDKLIGIEGDVVAKYIAKKNLLAAVQIGHFFFGNNGVGSR